MCVYVALLGRTQGKGVYVVLFGRIPKYVFMWPCSEGYREWAFSFSPSKCWNGALSQLLNRNPFP
jgi:hypothetical protein